MDEIRFYYEWEAFGCFSNYARIGFELDGVWWPSSEHFYHLQKFVYLPTISAEGNRLHDTRKAIYQAPTPNDAKSIADREAALKHPDWNNLRDDVMRKGVRRKFMYNPKIAAILCGTGDAILIEASHKDAHFGCGPDGNGENMLGRILMEVRSELRGEALGE